MTGGYAKSVKNGFSARKTASFKYARTAEELAGDMVIQQLDIDTKMVPRPQNLVNYNQNKKHLRINGVERAANKLDKIESKKSDIEQKT